MKPDLDAALKQMSGLVPTPGITSVMHGFYAVPGISLLAELGLVERWLTGDRVQIAGFCEERGLDSDFVQTWCDYFRLYGYLTEVDGLVGATPSGFEVLFRWPQIMLNYAYAPLCADLVGLARREKRYGYGKDVYRNMYFDAKGSGGLGSMLSFVQISDHLKSKGCKCLLDLGCGDGTFLSIACANIPGLLAVGIDQSEISVASAVANFARRGLEGRGQFYQGDLLNPGGVFENPVMREVEVATIMQILQELTGESTAPVLEFLRQFKTHLPGALLAVTEFYRISHEEMKAYVPIGVAESALHHDLSDQNLLPREQWLSLYEQAGFRVVDTLVHVQVPSFPPVIETIFLKAVG